MPKKCIICDEEAKLCIKGSNDCYCEECANENFGDISYLVKVEEEAKALKRLVDDKIEGSEESEMIDVNIKNED